MAIEYTGSSQLAVSPGGVSGELLGIDAVREFNVLTDTYGAEYGKRAGAQVSVVTQSGSNALHGTLFEFLRNSAWMLAIFSTRASVAAVPKESVRRRAGRAAEEEQAVPVRQLRRIPAGAGAEQRERGAGCAGAVGLIPNATTGVHAGVGERKSRMRCCHTCRSGRAERIGAAVERRCERHGVVVQQSEGNRFTKISERCGRIIRSAPRLAFGGVHDRQRQQPDPAGRSFIRVGGSAGRQVASVQETHVFSPTF